MKRDANCRNCGAPVTAPVCAYCGTPAYTPADALAGAEGKMLHCRYEEDGCEVGFVLFVHGISADYSYNTLYTDGFACKSVLDRIDIKIDAEALL